MPGSCARCAVRIAANADAAPAIDRRIVPVLVASGLTVTVLRWNRSRMMARPWQSGRGTLSSDRRDRSKAHFVSVALTDFSNQTIYLIDLID